MAKRIISLMMVVALSMSMFMLVGCNDAEKKLQQQIDDLNAILTEQAGKITEQENKIAELEEQLAAFMIEKNKSELKSVLSSRGLSAEFADIVNIGDDIEAAQANIDKLDKLFKAAVKAEVERRLATTGGNVRGNGTNSGTELTKEAAKKMSIAEMSKLAKEQPELFNKYFG